MGSSSPAEGSYYDNLTTISADEIKELILVDIKNTQYIEAIQEAFDAYTISVDANGTITVDLAPGYDRTISLEDQQVIYEELTKNVIYYYPLPLLIKM